jgi:hypothetical protein
VKKQLSLSQQLYLLMHALAEMPKSGATPEKYEEVLKWVRDVPPATRPPELTRAIARAFGKEEADVAAAVSGVKRGAKFEDLCPAKGWLASYMDFTRHTEPPGAFHFFVGAAVLGATLGRNVYVSKGAYNVYPNMCVVLVAPSGKCRKTSAANLGTDLIRTIGGRIIADKTTPEALVEAFKGSANATGLLYAPELAVFLGKQKYLEGMVPMLTSLFDAPREWSSATIMRGDAKLENVALSFIGCSTIDWIQTAIPKDAFGGGFMSRLLFVVLEDTDRCYAFPPPLSLDLKKDLLNRLLAYQHTRGEMQVTGPARAWYEEWYRKRGNSGDEQKQYAGYVERKPDHLLRIAMILRLSADPQAREVQESDLRAALRILDWIEAQLPDTFDQLDTTEAGAHVGRIVGQLKRRGGGCEYSALLRLNARRLSAAQFRQVLETMQSAKLIEYDQHNKLYYLTLEGWK